MNQQHQQQSQQAPQQQDSNNHKGGVTTGGIAKLVPFPPLGVGAGGLSSQHQQHQQTFPPHQLMGLMSNPALVAVASTHPLFQPSAMLSNPAAFLAMQPEAFGVNQTATQGMVTGAGGLVVGHHPQSLQSTAFSLPPIASTSFNIKDCDSAELALRQAELSPAERAKQNRDRNREHARSTRLRKKAYVVKLKELVEGLHTERADEIRARRVAVQHLAEKQGVRRGVVRSLLQFHVDYETDERKWKTILEDDFWLKQPVTPYRSFRRAEIEKVSESFFHASSLVCCYFSYRYCNQRPQSQHHCS